MSTELVDKLVEFGVLGVVVGWFMFRMEKIISDNTKAITSMTLVVQKLCDKVGIHNGAD